MPTRDDIKKVDAAIKVLRDSARIVTRTIQPPSPRDVLRALKPGEVTKFRDALVAGGIKKTTANRTIERQRTVEGRQQRGAKKGLTGKYADTLKAEFPEKFREKKETDRQFPGGKIDVDAIFYTSTNAWHGLVKLNLSSTQVELLAGAGSYEDFWDIFNSKPIYDFPECQRVDNVKKCKVTTAD